MNNIPSKWAVKITKENCKQVEDFLGKNTDAKYTLYDGTYFHFPNLETQEGFLQGCHIYGDLEDDWKLISPREWKEGVYLPFKMKDIVVGRKYKIKSKSVGVGYDLRSFKEFEKKNGYLICAKKDSIYVHLYDGVGAPEIYSPLDVIPFEDSVPIYNPCSEIELPGIYISPIDSESSDKELKKEEIKEEQNLLILC